MTEFDFEDTLPLDWAVQNIPSFDGPEMMPWCGGEDTLSEVSEHSLNNSEVGK